MSEIENLCVSAEVGVDKDHGPVVRTKIGGITIAVYLLSETGVCTRPSGQHGVEVTGPWPEFRRVVGDKEAMTGGPGDVRD